MWGGGGGGGKRRTSAVGHGPRARHEVPSVIHRQALRVEVARRRRNRVSDLGRHGVRDGCRRHLLRAVNSRRLGFGHFQAVGFRPRREAFGAYLSRHLRLLHHLLLLLDLLELLDLLKLLRLLLLLDHLLLRDLLKLLLRLLLHRLLHLHTSHGKLNEAEERMRGGGVFSLRLYIFLRCEFLDWARVWGKRTGW
eukprot:COSAG04_NODE_2070_length_4866_cov_72.921334_6_plen_194_part_00